jgi:ribosomal protein L17
MSAMGTKSRETLYVSSIRTTAGRAAEARKVADRLACEACHFWEHGRHSAMLAARFWLDH